MKALDYNPNQLIHKDCPNFKWYEVFKSGTASRLNIDNVEGFTDLHVINATDLVYSFLQPLRNELGTGIRVSSWYRCEALEKVICQDAFKRWVHNLDDNKNQSITGPPDFMWQQYFQRKSHPIGNAVDFEVPGFDNDYVFDLIQQGEYKFDQLIREYGEPGIPMSGWIHISAFENDFKNRQQILTRP